MLAIEFARVGDHGELATALCPGAAAVPTRWVELRSMPLDDAMELLRQREEIDPRQPQFLGSVSGLQEAAVLARPDAPAAFQATVIADWGRALGLDAVVWTALPPRFDGQNGRVPDASEALAYLRSLRGPVLEHARHYIECVPDEIRTPYRAIFEAELGWRSPSR